MRVPSSVGRALCSLFALTVMGCGRGDAPKIILFIADGAGVAHWTLARFATSDLAVTRMPVVGLVDTRGHGHTVSGSAPTATAYSTGLRTFMGAVGVGPDSVPAAGQIFSPDVDQQGEIGLPCESKGAAPAEVVVPELASVSSAVAWDIAVS